MTRRREPKTAGEKIRRVLDWAERQKLHNVAANLRAVLELLPEEPAAQPKRRP